MLISYIFIIFFDYLSFSQQAKRSEIDLISIHGLLAVVQEVRFLFDARVQTRAQPKRSWKNWPWAAQEWRSSDGTIDPGRRFNHFLSWCGRWSVSPVGDAVTR